MSLRLPHINALAIAALGMVCGTAIAAPGDHIRTGDTTITPGLDMGLEYSTNVYRSDTNPVGASNLRIVPGLDILVDSAQNEFKLGGEWELSKFISVADDGSAEFDRGARIKALDRFTDFNISAHLDALKKEKVGLQLSEAATLRSRETEQGLDGSPFTTQLRNSLGGGLRISPGPALQIVPGAVWSFDEYRLAALADTQDRFNARNTYGPNLHVKWNFFPRTAVVMRVDANFHRWALNEVDTGSVDPGFGSTVSLPNSNHYKVRTGLQGRFTERVFMDLLLGYATALYDESSLSEVTSAVSADVTGIKGLLVNSQVRYVITEETQLSVGYDRDFADSFFTNFVTYDRLSAGLAANVAGVRPSVGYSIKFESYQGEVVRNDVLNRFDVGLAYDVSKWAALSSTLYWQQRAIAQSIYQGAEYDDVEFFLGASFTY